MVVVGHDDDVVNEGGKIFDLPYTVTLVGVTKDVDTDVETRNFLFGGLGEGGNKFGKILLGGVIGLGDIFKIDIDAVVTFGFDQV